MVKSLIIKVITLHLSSATGISLGIPYVPPA